MNQFMRGLGPSATAAGVAFALGAIFNVPEATAAMLDTVTVVGCRYTTISDGWGNTICVKDGTGFDSGGYGSTGARGIGDYDPSGGGGSRNRQGRVAADQTKDCDGEEKKENKAEGAQAVMTQRPVVIASGKKVLPVTDFSTSESIGVPLRVARTYNQTVTNESAFGRGWTNSFERVLSFKRDTVECRARLDAVVSCSSSDPITIIYFIGESGYGNRFEIGGDGIWRSTNGSTLAQSGTNWVMTERSGVRSTFDAYGRPLQVVDERGLGNTYVYNSNNQLSQIQSSTGRSIQFTWSGPHIVAIIAPNGKAYGYGYNANGYLASAVYPDNHGTYTYHYEYTGQPGWLTGVSVNSVRYSRYAYNSDGRVAWSGLEGGVERSTFNYGSDYTEVTNALGQTTKYLLAEVNGSKQIIGVERPVTPSCSGGQKYTAYDAHGNVDYEVDSYGFKIDYTYDADDRVTQKIAGIGPNGETAQQRIIQYVWDPVRKNRLLAIKWFGSDLSKPVLEKAFTYFDEGSQYSNLLASVSRKNKAQVGIYDSTETTTYSYSVHPNGMVASMIVDGPIAGSGDAVTYSYDTAGNLLSAKNSLGHTAQFSNYNSLGQPGRITNANGGITDITYDGRGSVLTTARWAGQTAYVVANTYDNRGQIKRIQFPDGDEINYAYDSLGRVVSFTRKEKGSPYVPTSSGGSGVGLLSTKSHGKKLQPQGICADCEPGGEDPPPPPASEVRGVIDGLTTNKTAIVGWACSSGLSQSISVHLYLGGAAGTGTYYGAYQADLASEPAVASACAASGGNYRFSIPLTTNMREQFGGKAIYIYGISPVGGTNLLLNNSGTFTVSKMPPPPVGFVRYTYNLNSQVTKIESGIEYYSSDSSLTLAAAGSSSKLNTGNEGIAACYPDCYEPTPSPTTTATVLIQSSQYIDYDANGFVAAKRGNNSQVVRYTYNANGDLETVTDALGRVTRYEYDAHRQLSHVVDAANGHVWTTYDVLGNATRVQDPKGNVTAYAYDGFGHLWAQTSPDTGTTRFEWNTSGQRNKMTRQDGSWLAYEYDALGRITSAGNGATIRYYSYDWCQNGAGLLCGLALGTPAGTENWTHFGYSAQGELTVRRDSVYGSDDWTGYAYDGAGRFTGVSYPSGISVGYGYNTGQLTTVTATIGATTQVVLDKAYYQPFGAIGGWSYGNGLARRYSYDLDGRLTGVSVGDDASVVVQSLGFEFNAGSEMTRITNGVDPNQTMNLGYDALSRLTTANTASIGYDAVGNRTFFNALTYGVDPASNRLQYSVDPSLTRYFNTNANGNIYAYTGTDGVYNALTYDAFNRVSSHARAGAATTYSYNALDQRVGKSIGSSRFIYGSHSELLAENKSGIWSSYVWLNGELVGVVRNNQLYYVHSDQVSRPEAVTNSAKSVVWRANNTPFNRGIKADTFGGLSLGFPGQYWDAESGLWHNGFRSYEPTLGRYLQADPLGLAAGLNPYVYVGNNPLSFVDSLGLDREIIFWAPMWTQPGSWFGHVSTVGGNGENYSFGTHGWDRTYPTAQSYVDRQTSQQGPNRSGTGLVVGMTPEQDAIFDQCLVEKKAEAQPYNGLSNNCTTAAQQCLNAAGVNVPSSIFPQDFQDALWGSGSVIDVNGYPAK